MVEKKTFAWYMEACKVLRDAAFAAETKLYYHLVDFESSGTWKEAGFSTFDQLPTANKFGASEKYRNFVAATKVFPQKTIEKVGVPAATVGKDIRDPDKRATFIRSAILRVEEEGFPISEQWAKKVRQDVDPVETVPGNVAREERRLSKVDELEELVSKLKVDLRAARARISVLEAENLSLKKKIGR